MKCHSFLDCNVRQNQLYTHLNWLNYCSGVLTPHYQNEIKNVIVIFISQFWLFSCNSKVFFLWIVRKIQNCEINVNYLFIFLSCGGNSEIVFSCKMHSNNYCIIFIFTKSSFTMHTFKNLWLKHIHSRDIYRSKYYYIYRQMLYY